MGQVMLPPGPQLASCVDAFLVGSIPDGGAGFELLFPASARPRLILVTKGAGHMVSPCGQTQALPAAFVAGPKLSLRKYVIAPGSEFAMAVFRAGAFTRFFDRALNDFSRCIIALDELVPASAVSTLLARLHGAHGAGDAVETLKAFLTTAMSAMQKRQLFSLPNITAEHLALPAGELASTSSLSVRQFERRFLAIYGMPLRDYRRLTRYMQALPLVLSRPWEHGMVTRIAQDSGYFDQAHFIRDFKEFIGSAPGEFMKRRLADQPEHEFWKGGTRNLPA